MAIDWKSLFVPSVSIVEILARGSITYLALFTLLRLVLKRESGAVGISDLLLLVLIADAAQNALSGGYTSITDGLILVGTIIFWNYSLDWLGYHFPKTIGRLLRPPPLRLIKDGRIDRRNLRRELITMEELISELRASGVEQVDEVKEMYIEGDGTFSIILKKKDSNVKSKAEDKKDISIK